MVILGECSTFKIAIYWILTQLYLRGLTQTFRRNSSTPTVQHQQFNTNNSTPTLSYQNSKFQFR